MSSYTAQSLEQIAALFDRNKESAERSARITAITAAQKNKAIGEAAAYARAAEVLRDTLIVDDQRSISSASSPEMVMLESVAIARTALQAQQQIARCLHSAVILMTLPPFKRDNATVNPDGSLTINPSRKDT